MDDLAEDYRALRQTVGVVELARDFLRVSGPDAVTFLQGQLSQDVSALVVGTAAEALLLQPQGKVDALLRVTRTGHDELVLDVDAGWGGAVATRLGRFKIRVKAVIEPLAWRCSSVRGPDAHGVAIMAGLGVASDWPGSLGVDVIGEAPAVGGDVRRCGESAWQAVRIESGIPAMGSELTEKTIPAEAGVVDRTVSFTKGCYTGQELVARIDSRGGNVPRRLRGVEVVGHAVVPVGNPLRVGDKEVGVVTSVAWSPRLGGTVALASVRREIEPPADAELAGDGGVAARILTLPVVP